MNVAPMGPPPIGGPPQMIPPPMRMPPPMGGPPMMPMPPHMMGQRPPMRPAMSPVRVTKLASFS